MHRRLKRELSCPRCLARERHARLSENSEWLTQGEKKYLIFQNYYFASKIASTSKIYITSTNMFVTVKILQNVIGYFYVSVFLA